MLNLYNFIEPYLKVDIQEIKPNVDFLNKHVKGYDKELVQNYILTNTRTIQTYSIDFEKVNSDDNSDNELKQKVINTFMKLRALVCKYQYKFPMKYLKPDVGNYYVSQKTALNSSTKKITDAYKQVEPLSIGFDFYISQILINQQLPLGTVVSINIENDYSSNRKFIRSNSLKTQLDNLTYEPYCKTIHIGAVDTGSVYSGKFVVSERPINSDTFCKFSFKVKENEFSLITYNHLVDTSFKQLVSELSSIVGLEF